MPISPNKLLSSGNKSLDQFSSLYLGISHLAEKLKQNKTLNERMCLGAQSWFCSPGKDIGQVHECES